ncbi:MAG: hypothetical protein V2I56_16815 [Desulfobacteraceae bacterium]|nr:hypothetical protein [Desulfobacteraceae bacterium]
MTRNPALFQGLTFLDAGSVIPDLIRDRHDRQKESPLRNSDTVRNAGVTVGRKYVS